MSEIQRIPVTPSISDTVFLPECDSLNLVKRSMKNYGSKIEASRICAYVEIVSEEYLICECSSKNRWCSKKPGDDKSFSKGTQNTKEDPYLVERTGLLGELAFAKIAELPVDIGYREKGDSQDFLCDKKTIDVKANIGENNKVWRIRCRTEYGYTIPVDKDIYVFTRVEKDDREIKKAIVTIIGYCWREEIVCKNEKKAEAGHYNYEIYPSDIHPIEELFKVNHQKKKSQKVKIKEIEKPISSANIAALDEIREICQKRIEELGLKEVYAARVKEEYDDLKNWKIHRNVDMAGKLLKLRKKNIKSPVNSNVSGSVILYLLGISAIDPIDKKLSLKKSQIVMGDCPDIDTDFDSNIKEWVKNHIVELFGKSKTCSIGTYQTYKTKAVILDVARVFGLNLMEISAITKQMDSLAKFEVGQEDDSEAIRIDEMEFDEIIIHYPDLGKYFVEHPDVRHHAEILRNQVKNMSKHAAGMIISNFDLHDKIPVYRDKDGDILSAWSEGQDTHELSKVGLVKFDILGLSNLSIISDCLKMIEKTTGRKIAKKDIPLNDREAIKFGSKNEMVGVFQFENPMTQKIVDDIGMESIFDISAVTSLIRPGPKDEGMHEEYGRRKKGGSYNKMAFLEDVLDETFFVITYQEHVQLVAQKVAGFSPVESNRLRKVLIKEKNEKVLAELKKRFMEGAQERVKRGEMTKKEVEDIYAQCKSFAKYGFCRSHAFSYSAITAAEFWLKFNFPVQFMAAVLNNTKSHHKKHGSENILADYINYCRRNNYVVLPPDINESEVGFTVEKEAEEGGMKRIRYSLGHIKNLGTCASDVKECAPYQSIEDMYERIPRRRVTKRVVESLIKAGAFDSLYEGADIAEKRNAALESYYKLRKNKKDVLKMWNFDKWKEAEREMLGVVLSVPPLCKEYADLIEEKNWCLITDSFSEKDRVNVFGRIEKVTNTIAKSSGRQMLIVELSDDIDSVGFYVFENSMKKFDDQYRIGHIVAIPLNRFEDGGRRFFDVHRNGVVIKEGG